MILNHPPTATMHCSNYMYHCALKWLWGSFMIMSAMVPPTISPYQSRTCALFHAQIQHQIMIPMMLYYKWQRLKSSIKSLKLRDSRNN